MPLTRGGNLRGCRGGRGEGEGGEVNIVIARNGNRNFAKTIHRMKNVMRKQRDAICVITLLSRHYILVLYKYIYIFFRMLWMPRIVSRKRGNYFAVILSQLWYERFCPKMENVVEFRGAQLKYSVKQRIEKIITIIWHISTRRNFTKRIDDLSANNFTITAVVLFLNRGANTECTESRTYRGGLSNESK